MTDSPEPPSFRLAYVPGVTPAKWVRIWNERLPDIRLELVQVAPAEASDVLRDGGADAGLVRLPVDRTVFSAIPLYTETSVVVVPKDHVVTAVEEVTVEDLADEVVLHPLDDVIGWDRPPGEPAFERPATTADAIELVAANIGVLVVPQSLARLHHRRDLTYRPLTDAPQSEIALAWREDATTDMVEDFIGIVRGRTVNSSRGRTQPEPERGQRPEKGGGRKPAGAGKGTARGSSGAGKGSRGGSGRSGGSGGSGGSKGAGARRGKPRRRG
ncbi:MULTISPECIES: LysR substrate-binding domain-containing protein [Streptomyces]|uniref:Regulatory protein n=1 Tax=Streptomyces sviceus (strain ATCC 29083 / DSM 924 / JCM 4929 / NBRC 13980 / NCIMB 11184 / NRRL 5439 / UC 5370) TaxID=463191 RepID=B5I613_STRX2|nr:MULTISPECIES: LysR substrate-binding domain-containing protein [Streptomyces]EDY60518.1 regulatory protein [Streptomyces sviceus ATCC 29083]MYT04098.1 LysR family transcriptional regulator [Streptomyces sp. SID5470]